MIPHMFLIFYLAFLQLAVRNALSPGRIVEFSWKEIIAVYIHQQGPRFVAIIQTRDEKTFVLTGEASADPKLERDLKLFSELNPSIQLVHSDEMMAIDLTHAPSFSILPSVHLARSAAPPVSVGTTIR